MFAAKAFTALYLLLSRPTVSPAYQGAITVSAMVCGIAAYHYFRIFENFRESYPAGSTTSSPHVLSAVKFNEGYRYVDWLLTVPLLLFGAVAVLALAKAVQKRLQFKLIPAATAMILVNGQFVVFGDPSGLSRRNRRQQRAAHRVGTALHGSVPLRRVRTVHRTEYRNENSTGGCATFHVDAPVDDSGSLGRLSDRLPVPRVRRFLLRRGRRVCAATGWIFDRRHSREGRIWSRYLENCPNEECPR